jgi:hypothetical protein
MSDILLYLSGVIFLVVMNRNTTEEQDTALEGMLVFRIQ